MKEQRESTRRATRASTRNAGGRDAQPTVRETRKRSTVNVPPPKAPPAKRRKTTGGVDTYISAYKGEKADPNASSILFRQPRELFLQIISHLPAEATICLSLTCKLSLLLIGSSCWSSPDVKGRWAQSRANLLQCLSRDAPLELTLCYMCNSLHPPLQPPATHRATKLTKACMSQWALIDYFAQVKDDATGTGYSLVFPHINGVFIHPSSAKTLSANVTVTTNQNFKYTLESSASWINHNLVLRHLHTFSPGSSTASLRLDDLLNLPLQLCAHQSTTRDLPVKQRYTPDRPAISPVLTHAICSAFPPEKRTNVPKASVFRAPSPLEQKQMAAADEGEGVIWKCRGCTTKYHVAFVKGDVLITTWHCFGRDLPHAKQYFGWMVRREAYNLGKTKRNSEFWYQSRTVPDFKIK